MTTDEVVKCYQRVHAAYIGKNDPTLYTVMAYIVMACIVMACIVMAYRVMAYIGKDDRTLYADYPGHKKQFCRRWLSFLAVHTTVEVTPF